MTIRIAASASGILLASGAPTFAYAAWIANVPLSFRRVPDTDAGRTEGFPHDATLERRIDVRNGRQCFSWPRGPQAEFRGQKVLERGR